MAPKKTRTRKPQTGVELSEEGQANLSWLKQQGFTHKGAIERALAELRAKLSGKGL